MNPSVLTREKVLEIWREQFRKHRYDIEYCEGILNRFLEVMRAEDEPIGEEMVQEFWEVRRNCVQIAESEHPLGFVKPSWEQAQVLNAWSPEFEPHIAPKGYRSVCNFSANRTLKTAGSIFDTLLWILPNDPEWRMFETFEDEEGRKHGNDRGPYRVLLRPDWNTWRRTGRMIYSKDEPPKDACEIWHGVQDADHWKLKVGKEYLRWMPRSMLGVRSDGGTAVFQQDRMIKTKYGHSIIGKTYQSDIQAWSGDAVWRINADEGFEHWLFNEMMLRLKGGGYFHWAYTAAEPRNIGARAKLACNCYKGKHKLVGQAKFFTNFELAYVPSWAMDPDKKADDIARLEGEGAEGRVRMKGGFFESSPTVFSNFERERNILPIEGSDGLLAIRGEVPLRWVDDFGKERAERLSDAFYQANIVRGFDEGLANPSACTWQALLRTGEHVTFREWECAGLSIGERCEQIIDRSGNMRELMNPEAREERRRWKEKRPSSTEGMAIRFTHADSKMFRRDPEKPSDDFTENYIRAGLKIERAGNIGPGARCDFVNEMLRADPTRKHLLDSNKPGCRMYVTRDCVKVIERAEGYLWQQIAQGQRMGDFTDKPETKDDHTVDAWCYPAISKARWKDMSGTVTAARTRYDQLTGAVVR